MTVATFDPNAAAVTMTAAALKHFEQALVGHDNQLVRLGTQASGCTGYAYVLDLVDKPEADDVLLQASDKVRLAVSSEALSVLRGTEIDLVVEGINSVIKFNNPNVVAECGCGESFSVS
jgi:iron-sulfur cluster assembly accessory protein